MHKDLAATNLKLLIKWAYRTAPSDPARRLPCVTDEQEAPSRPVFWADTAGATDELGRGTFARRIADALANQPGDAGMVVALYGPWGAGKSTILEYVQGYIESAAADAGSVVFVRFNPWFYNTEFETVADFFKLVAGALGHSLKKWNEEAGKRLAKLGSIAKGFGFGHAGVQVGGGVLESIGNAIGAPRNLRECYELLEYLLNDEPAVANNTRIIIAIDDLDRTDADSIAVIFRLIKLAANLPRISYLLAFDEEVVAEALGAKYPSGRTDGTSFLEKIVQVPLHVPRADPSQVAVAMFGRLAKALASHRVELTTLEEFELQSRLDSCVWPGVTTLRAGKQILNAVTFAIPVMLGEVHVGDQIMVESLRVLYPKVDKFVRNNKDLTLAWVTDKSQLAYRAGELDKALATVDDARRVHCKRILTTLFPAIENMYATRIDGTAEYQKWGLERRVCSASYFDRYFTYGLPFGDILDGEIDAVVAGETTDPGPVLRRLLAENKPDLVIEKLIERSSGSHGEHAARLASVVGEAADDLPGFDHPSLPGSIVRRAAYLVTILSQRIDAAQRAAFLNRLLRDVDPRFSLLVFRWLEAAAAQGGSGSTPLAREEVAEVGSGLAGRLLSVENLRVFYEDAPELAKSAVSLCRRFGDGALVPRLLVDVLEASEQATINFLQIYLPHSRENQPGSPLARAGYEYISGLVPPAKLMALLAGYFPGFIGPFDESNETDSAILRAAKFLETPINWVYRFAEIYRCYGDYAPLAPPSVYEPSAQQPSPFRNDHPRNKLASSRDGSDFIVRVALRVPDAIGLPGGLAGTGAANLYGSARESLLVEHLSRSALSAWFARWSAGFCECQAGPWQVRGANQGETSTFVIRSSGSEGGEAGRRASLECVVNTGTIQALRDGLAVEVAGMYVCLDLSVAGIGASTLGLDELPGVVAGMLGIIGAAEAIARSLVGNGDYTAGELACMFATGRASIDEIWEIANFPGIEGNHAQKDVEVFSTLPLRSIYPDAEMAAIDDPDEPRIRFALEFARKALERAGKRDYLGALHEMLPRLLETPY